MLTIQPLKELNNTFQHKYQLQRLLKENQVMIPSDKETLLLLYGRGRNAHNTSVQSMQGRTVSPNNHALLESVSSRDKLYESEYGKRENYGSPTNPVGGKMLPISPELNYDSCRILSEGRASTENQENEHNFQNLRPKSSMSTFKNTRYFSMPRARERSKHSISSSRVGIPSYFKDAAELLVSRVLKQMKRHFDHLKRYSDGKL